MATINQKYDVDLLYDLGLLFRLMESEEGAMEIKEKLDAHKHQDILESFRKTVPIHWPLATEVLAPALEDILGRFAKPKPQLQTFIGFSRLPAELRLRIWEQVFEDASSPRIIELVDDVDEYDREDEGACIHGHLPCLEGHSILRPTNYYACGAAKSANRELATLARACSEARAVVLKKYAGINAQSLNSTFNKGSTFLFNFAHDIFLVNTECENLNEKFHKMGDVALSKIQTIILDLEQAQMRLGEYYGGDELYITALSRLKSLKRVILHIDSLTTNSAHGLPLRIGEMLKKDRDFYEPEYNSDIKPAWDRLSERPETSHLRNVEFQLAHLEPQGLFSKKLWELADEAHWGVEYSATEE
jgi:hypothetical protein